jgi:hypothetical protein
MSEYRIQVISRHGSIIRTVTVECRDDKEAHEKAVALAEYSDVELWQADRKVATIRATKY